MDATSFRTGGTANGWKEPSRRLGDYELIAELAQGGMGRVFLARRVAETGFERLCAIKVIHEHMADDDEAVSMLLDEASLAAHVHHPNVVPVIDIGNQDGGYFVVMDYVEGCSLAELMRRTRKRRPERLVVPLMLDALRGLHAAHELTNSEGSVLNFVHRDFSPQNLLIGLDGGCRVTDFGVAKAEARLTQTKSSIQKGKLSYMAPEQLNAESDLDRRVDIWAAGVVFYYALTGVHPFRDKAPGKTIQSVLYRDVPPPSTVGLEPSRHFDAFCLKALNRDRRQRFRSAQEMADELQRIAIWHDLLAPQSEVSALVRKHFDAKLEERRKLIRAFRQGGETVAWLSAPVLPSLATPSTGGPRVRDEKLKQAAPPESSSATLPLTGSPLKMALPALALSPALPPPVPADARRGRERRFIVKMLTGMGVGGAASLVLCMAALFLYHHLLSGEPEAVTEVTAEERSALLTAEPATERAAQRQVALEPVGDLIPLAAVGVADDGDQGQNVPPAGTSAISRAVVGLTAVPEGARIRLDGVEVRGDSWSVPADGREHTLRVDAPGRAQWMQRFNANGDVSFDASVAPAHHHDTRVSRRDRRPRSGRLLRNPGF